MKIIDAITTIDAIKPNSYSVAMKVRWLSLLDGKVKKEMIDTHEGEIKDFYEYTESDTQKELLIEHPYDDIYIRWLEMQIDYASGEYTRYNNSKMMFTTAYNTYANYYNRTHMPITHGKFKL